MISVCSELFWSICSSLSCVNSVGIKSRKEIFGRGRGDSIKTPRNQLVAACFFRIFWSRAHFTINWPFHKIMWASLWRRSAMRNNYSVCRHGEFGLSSFGRGSYFGCLKCMQERWGRLYIKEWMSIILNTYFSIAFGCYWFYDFDR